MYVFANPSTRTKCDTGSIFKFNKFWFSFFPLLDWLPYQCYRTPSVSLFIHSERKNRWIPSFPNSISTMWNENRLVQNLNSDQRVISYGDIRYTQNDTILLCSTPLANLIWTSVFTCFFHSRRCSPLISMMRLIFNEEMENHAQKKKKRI